MTRADHGPEATSATVGLIWAQAHGRVIGRAGTVPWYVPEDLAHFRRVTTGHPVIMGRRTWESLPDRFRPLPGRRNIVVSHRSDLRLHGADVAHSLPEAVRLAGDGEVWVVGGGQVYAEALALASVVEVTEIDLEVEGDVHAPPLDGWTPEAVGDWHTSRTGVRYRHRRYRRPERTGPLMPG